MTKGNGTLTLLLEIIFEVIGKERHQRNTWETDKSWECQQFNLLYVHHPAASSIHLEFRLPEDQQLSANNRIAQVATKLLTFVFVGEAFIVQVSHQVRRAGMLPHRQGGLG